MIRRLALATVLTALPASALAEDLGLWEAAVVMADGNVSESVARTDAMRDVLAGFAADLSVDEASLDLLRELRDATLELDLAALYKLLPEVDGESRALSQHGESLGPTGYLYTLYPSAAQRGSGALGDSDVRTQMTPVVHDFGKGAGYAIRQDLTVGMGPVGHRDLALAFDRILVELDKAAKSAPSEAVMTRARRLQPQLTGQTDLALIGAVEAAFPQVAKTLSSFLIADRVGVVNDGALEVDLRGHLDSDDLRRAGYGDLARYGAKVGDLLRINMILTDGQGDPLVKFNAQTDNLSVRIRFVTNEGALIPTHQGHRVDRPVRLSDRSIDMWLSIGTEIRTDGVLFRVSDYAIPIQYRSRGGTADIAVDITDEPTIEFTGTNKFTSLFAEIADSALNLEAHGRVVFQAVAEGLDGRGSRARMTYTDGARSSLSASTDLILVDNPLIGFGMKIVGNHLAPNDEVVRDLMDLIDETLEALDQDYAAARPGLVSSDRP